MLLTTKLCAIFSFSFWYLVGFSLRASSEEEKECIINEKLKLILRKCTTKESRLTLTGLKKMLFIAKK